MGVDAPRGPVPRFKRVVTTKELEARINPQPAFRRADPEGGFISVRMILIGRFFFLQLTE